MDNNEVTVICDKCMSFMKMKIEKGMARANIMKKLRRKGWIVADGGKDLCPHCAKKEMGK